MTHMHDPCVVAYTYTPLYPTKKIPYRHTELVDLNMLKVTSEFNPLHYPRELDIMDRISTVSIIINERTLSYGYDP